MKTLSEFNFNGFAALESVLQETYGGVAQAIAQLSLFSHPETVLQTNNMGLFRIVRATAVSDRGKILAEKKLVFCDNTSCQKAFLWAHSLSYNQFKDVQFNHIYSINEPDYYTSLANICVTPVFLAKLTDTNQEIKKLLRYRVWDIYGFLPVGYTQPAKPQDYDKLSWAPYMPAVKNLVDVISKRLDKNKKSNAALSASNFGWLLKPISV